MGEKRKKGLGGLTPEKKKLLKQLIMAKAAEDLKRKQEAEAEEKRKIIEERVPKLDVEGLDQAGMEKKVKALYEVVVALEEEKYDWELKIRKQEYEINELTIKVNDIKGKFPKPVLKKVNKTESKLAKFDKAKLKSSSSFRDQLKSSGKSKFDLEEVEEKAKPDWVQDGLHKKEEEKDEEAPRKRRRKRLKRAPRRKKRKRRRKRRSKASFKILLSAS